MTEKDFRLCFRCEDVKIDEYFMCLPYIMGNYDMEPMLASPKNLLSEKNDFGTRSIVIFQADHDVDTDPEIFDVDEILAFIHDRIHNPPKYEA